MPTDLNQRLGEIEQRLSAIEAALSIRKPEPLSPQAPPSQPAPPRSINWEAFGSGEGWLGRVGIGLLVVGLILLFRYAVARGWLTPELRIGIGLVVGMALLGSGVRFFSERRLYRQILMGGGIVVLFITGLAAAELYHLIRGGIALLYFLALAGAAFTIATKQEDPTIASIGALGALLPPAFLLAHLLPGAVLSLYLLVVIAWTGVLVVSRGWERTLLVTAGATALANFHKIPDRPSAQIAAGAALLGAWLCFSALPLLRKLHSTILLALPILMTIAVAFTADQVVLRNAHMFEITTAVAAVFFAAIAVALRSRRTADASGMIEVFGEPYRVDGYGAAAVASALSLAASAVVGFGEPGWPGAIAVIATVAMWIAHASGTRLLKPVMHLLYGLIAIGFLLSVDPIAHQPAFDTLAVAYASAALLAALVAFGFLHGKERVAYVGAVYFAVLVLLATELTAVRQAPWLASASYGALGSALLIAGLARREILVQRAGLLSLALLVARLFIYDLAKVDVGVRIILFMACGVAFLGLSYLVRSRRFVH